MDSKSKHYNTVTAGVPSFWINMDFFLLLKSEQQEWKRSSGMWSSLPRKGGEFDMGKTSRYDPGRSEDGAKT